jgi:hypothetical protein
MIKNDLIDGIFFDAPNLGCIRELYYVPSEDVYGLQTYFYDNIINIHNQCVTDAEFKTRFLMSADMHEEFVSDADAYKKIEDILGKNIVIPDCIGLSRSWLYSMAALHHLNDGCNNCVHSSVCKDKTKTCDKFISNGALTSKKTTEILRRYFVDEISKLYNYDKFLEYTKVYNISAELLKSLNINYIVFFEAESRINSSRGHAQVYSDRDKAERYAKSLVRIHSKEAQNYQIRKSLNKSTEESSTTISYDSKFGKVNIKISIATI